MNGSPFLLVLAACSPAVPETPSFQQDVLPILAANCVRCHGFPVIGGAPPEFRLDTFEDVEVTDGVVISGAATYARAIPARLRDETLGEHPRFPLDDYQIETLERWAQTAGRGAPRPANSVPTVAIEDTSQSGSVVSVRVRVDDDDGDLAAGTVRATLGGIERIVGPIRSGIVEFVWDVTGIPPGLHRLAAQVDDGAEVHELPLGTISVEVL